MGWGGVPRGRASPGNDLGAVRPSHLARVGCFSQLSDDFSKYNDTTGSGKVRPSCYSEATNNPVNSFIT